MSKDEKRKLSISSSLPIKKADCFKCSIDYLVGRADDFGSVHLTFSTESELTAKELHFLQNYRRISKTLQPRAEEYLQALISLTEKEAAVWETRTPPSL